MTNTWQVFERVDIVRGLLWHVPGQKILDERALCRGLGDGYDGRSWSWAGVPGNYTIENDHAACPDRESLSVILGIEVEYKHPSYQFDPSTAA